MPEHNEEPDDQPTYRTPEAVPDPARRIDEGKPMTRAELTAKLRSWCDDMSRRKGWK